jgi:hypothetical protein
LTGLRDLSIRHKMLAIIMLTSSIALHFILASQ